MLKATSFILAIPFLVSAAAAADVTFADGPTVSTDADAVTISFTLSEPTDVEVAILDAAGKVVRHLAAGRVGAARAAAPLKAGSLKQALRWDRTGDDGRQVLSLSKGKPVAGAVSVRVRAGLGAKLGRLIGGSPYRGQATATPYRGSLQGVAIDGQGNVYVKMMSDVRSHGNTGLWPWQLRKFDAQGKYVRTLLPYPPSAAAKAHGYSLIDAAGGHFTPVNQNSLYPVFAVFGSNIYHRVRKGEVVFVNSQARRMTFFKVDGSNAIRQVDMWPKKLKMPAPAWLDFEVAFSPDGKYAYYANVAGSIYDGKTPDQINPDWPNGRVYRHDLSRPGAAPEPFFDLKLPDFATKKYWIPSAWDKRTAAAAVATDAKGNVYVCDQVNQQVITVSPEGKELDAVKLPWPDRVQVHPTTGDLYVVSRQVGRGYIPPNKLLKVTGRGAGAKVVATLAMKTRGNVEFTIDARRQPTVLWVLAPGKNPSGQSLLRVEDRGDKLAVIADAFDRDNDAMAFAGNLAVDRAADLVYITDTRGKVFRYDGRSGRGGPTKLIASHLAVGPDGRVVRVAGWNSALTLYTRDLKPIPVGPDGKTEFSHFWGRAGRGCSLGGLTIDHRGWIWALTEGGGMFVRAYKGDGAEVPAEHSQSTGRDAKPAPAIVAGFDIHASCVRVDRRGNIYVGWLGRPKDHKPPKGYAKDPAYRSATGSILKFGPAGGRRLKLKRGQKPPEGSIMGFEGVQQVYPGLGPFSRWRCAGSCVCTKPRFDVDGFGRLVIANAMTFSVSVVDNAGNPLATFGQYGNFDARGEGSSEPVPAIPLGWPTNAAVAGDRVYVADVLNHRIVRVDLSYALTKTLAVHAGGRR